MKVMSTLVEARKPSTNSEYAKVWNGFKLFATYRCSDPAVPSSSLLLIFCTTRPYPRLRPSSFSGGPGSSYFYSDAREMGEKTCLSSNSSKQFRPPVRFSFPSWESALCLGLSDGSAFRPNRILPSMEPDTQDYLSVAVTSGRKASEVQAFGGRRCTHILFRLRELQTVQDFDPKVPSRATLSVTAH